MRFLVRDRACRSTDVIVSKGVAEVLAVSVCVER